MLFALLLVCALLAYQFFYEDSLLATFPPYTAVLNII
jgi:hypothetical protein